MCVRIVSCLIVVEDELEVLKVGLYLIILFDVIKFCNDLFKLFLLVFIIV